MAWEEITWSCGHKVSKQMYGPHDERYRYIAWAEEHGLCPDCYREVKEAERERENAKNRASVPETLPAIDGGTEKQNAYAEDLRAALWSTLEAAVVEIRADPKCPPEYTELTAEGFLAVDKPGPKFYRQVFAVRDPRYWIDVVGRGRTLQSIATDPRTRAFFAGEDDWAGAAWRR